MLTTVLVAMMATINPATRVMDLLHAVTVTFLTKLVKKVKEINISCGTTLKEDAKEHPQPVIKNIYYTEEIFVVTFVIINYFLFIEIVNF